MDIDVSFICQRIELLKSITTHHLRVVASLSLPYTENLRDRVNFGEFILLLTVLYDYIKLESPIHLFECFDIQNEGNLTKFHIEIVLLLWNPNFDTKLLKYLPRTVSKPVFKQFLRRVVNFQPHSNLPKNITPSELFAYLDKNDTGRVPIAKLLHFANQLGIIMTTSEKANIAKDLDRKNTGLISKEDFEKNWIDENSEESEDIVQTIPFQEIFKKLDSNNDGVLSIKQFYTAITKFSDVPIKLPRKEIEKILQHVQIGFRVAKYFFVCIAQTVCRIL